MQLNEQQLLAVEHVDGPCIVTSIPGSGKTSTLTSRVVRLVEKGINPENILCITFTNKAANEMKERVAAKLGEKAKKIYIGTFHSFFLHILRKVPEKIGLKKGFSIFGDKDQSDLMSKICRMNEVTVSSYDIYNLCKIVNNYREDVVPFDSYMNDVATDEQKSIVSQYLQMIDKLNAIDFSGILHKVYNLLVKHNDICSKISAKYKYILGDEWQDTNSIQYEIIKKIASHNNLFVVADENQSVYSFRNARPENLNKMKNEYPNVREITLFKNYRSSKQILAVAQKVIRQNSNASNVVLVSEKGDGPDVSVKGYLSPEEESIDIAHQIIYLKNKYGYDWKDFAILYRVNSLSRSIEMALRNAEMPYKVWGGFSFFDRAEIKTMFSYLSLLTNPSNTIAFARAIQNPKRNVGDVVIGKIEKIAHDKNISIIDACDELDKTGGISQNARKSIYDFTKLINKYREQQNKLSISELSYNFIKESGFYDSIQKESKKDDDSQKRLDNLNEMLVSLSDYSKKNPKSDLSEYLHAIELSSSSDKNEKEDENKIALMTIHASKGLEFPVVFATGVETGLIPHKNAVNQAEIEEERRLFYIQISRCKQFLSISYVYNRKKFDTYNKQHKTVKTTASPFIHFLLPNEN